MDAISWHTYDFHSDEIGTTDHHPLDSFDANVSRLFDKQYLDYVGSVHENITKIVAMATHNAPPPPVWLTETNSICHQGVFNFTNAFGNSLWLVNRLGVLAAQGLPVMARQSLIGYNYSLLGNFPTDPIYPAPDYYTTVLFNKLVATTYLPTLSPVSKRSVSLHAYCARNVPGGIVVVVANFDGSEATTIRVNLTASAKNPGTANVVRHDYALAPHSDSVHPSDAGTAGEVTHPRRGEEDGFWFGESKRSVRNSTSYPLYTSRVVMLNGAVLSVSPQGGLPTFSPVATTGNVVTVPPQTILFAVFPDVQAEACL